MSIMRNTKMTDQWIADAIRQNPTSVINDPATGLPTEAIRTCPVRLSFVDVFRPQVARAGGQVNPNAAPKFKATLLFPPGVPFDVLSASYFNAVRKFFPQHNIRSDGTIFEPYPLHSPFRNQAEKLKHNGYTEGAVFMTCSTKFRPPVVDLAMNSIVDEARVYPGVWAIVALNTYQYGVAPPQPKKGIGFGLLSVMIVQDDENIGAGGQADPHKVFSTVNINANFNVPAAFGAAALMPPGGAPVGGQGGLPIQPLPATPAVDPASLY